VSGRQLVNIAYQHLRPAHHADGCGDQCARDCPVRAFSEALAAPVLPSEIAEEKAREERFRAFAEQLNSFSRGE
jgi:hypothetical protein